MAVIITTLLLLSTHSHDPSYWGSLIFLLVVHQLLLLSIPLVSSTVTSAGSVHKSRGDNVVRVWVQLKR